MRRWERDATNKHKSIYCTVPLWCPRQSGVSLWPTSTVISFLSLQLKIKVSQAAMLILAVSGTTRRYSVCCFLSRIPLSNARLFTWAGERRIGSLISRPAGSKKYCSNIRTPYLENSQWGSTVCVYRIQNIHPAVTSKSVRDLEGPSRLVIILSCFLTKKQYWLYLMIYHLKSYSGVRNKK